VNMTRTNNKQTIEVVSVTEQRRRRWSVTEKAALVRQTYEPGMSVSLVADGQCVSGMYRRSVRLVSGRYAVLDDGKGFSLVPWKQVIEQRLGQQIAATVRGGTVSWNIGKQRGLSIG
jgi:transposase-like protein